MSLPGSLTMYGMNTVYNEKRLIVIITKKVQESNIKVDEELITCQSQENDSNIQIEESITIQKLGST